MIEFVPVGGIIVTASDSRRRMRDELDSSAQSAIEGNIDNFEKKYLEELKARKMIKNDSDANDALADLRKSLAKLGKSGKTLASD